MLLVIIVVALVLNAAGEVTGFVIAAAIGSGFMAASSSPATVFAALLLIFAYWMALSDRTAAEPTWSAGIFARAVAYLVDLFAAFAILPPLLALPLLWAEAGRTGSFSWSIERAELVPTDATIGIPLLMLGVVLLNLYFAYPLTQGTQTPGCRLLGIRIIDFDNAERVPMGRAVLRSFLAFLAACGFFITLPVAWWSGERGVMWYDEIMDTRAVKLKGAVDD
jgi:uncharacterized RDD family membrane protein YckC